jgi:hypothetical protein
MEAAGAALPPLIWLHFENRRKSAPASCQPKWSPVQQRQNFSWLRSAPVTPEATRSLWLFEAHGGLEKDPDAGSASPRDEVTWYD